jgi:hypothetical protein
MNVHNAELTDPPPPLETPELVDAFCKVRRERIDLGKRVEALKEEETAYKEQIMHRMIDSGQHVLSSKKFSLKLGRSDEPTVTDWGQLDAFILTNKRLDLLHRRLTASAVKEMWNEGEVVPGVGSYPVFDVSVSDLSK